MFTDAGITTSVLDEIREIKEKLKSLDDIKDCIVQLDKKFDSFATLNASGQSAQV